MKKKSLGTIGLSILLFIIFGYPIQAFIPFVLDIDSNPVNVGFRIVILFISFLLLFTFSFSASEEQGTNVGWYFFMGFWIIYTIRLIYDIEIKGLRYLTTDAFFVYSFAFGVALIPAIMAYKVIPVFDIRKLPTIAMVIILLSNVCLIYAVMSYGEWNLAKILLSRANVVVQIGKKEMSIVNPITIGFFGQTLAILAIHLLNFTKNITHKYRMFLFACLGLGLLNLVVGASRGPMVFFVLLLIVEFYMVVKNKRHLGVLFLKVFSGVTILIVLLASYVSSKLKDGDIELINRMASTVESRQKNDKEERDYEWAAAWRQFKENPILGDAFVNDYDNSYSHNLILDVLMSTGLVGAFLFGGMLFYVFRKSFRIIYNIRSNHNESIIVLFFFGAFFISMTSGGLFMSASFWIFCTMILCLDINNRRRFKKKYDYAHH